MGSDEVRRAVEQAEAVAGSPSPESLFDDVYAEPLWQQRGQLEERRALPEDPALEG